MTKEQDDNHSITDTKVSKEERYYIKETYDTFEANGFAGEFNTAEEAHDFIKYLNDTSAPPKGLDKREVIKRTVTVTKTTITTVDVTEEIVP